MVKTIIVLLLLTTPVLAQECAPSPAPEAPTRSESRSEPSRADRNECDRNVEMGWCLTKGAGDGVTFSTKPKRTLERMTPYQDAFCKGLTPLECTTKMKVFKNL